MMNVVVPTRATIPIFTRAATQRATENFPVGRIFCIGRNYREHAIEMGYDPDREPPFFFMKPADAAVDAGTTTSTTKISCVIPYPSMTKSLHYEAELVVAIGKGGLRIREGDALDHVFGYCVGCDLTRRDLQAEAKKLKRPWATAKGFDFSAPMGNIVPKHEMNLLESNKSEGNKVGAATSATTTTMLSNACISLSVNGKIRQESTIDKMIWSIPEMISHLSTYFHLKPGDLIMTGTPAGVDDLDVGDIVEVLCGGLPKCTFVIGESH